MKKSLLFICLVCLFSCKKENSGDGDSQMPVIMMTAPTHNQAFSAGQTITINGSISDNIKVVQLHLEIINTTTGAFLTHEHFAPNAASYALSKTFVAQANSTYKIKVEAEDANGNNARSEVTVLSN
jgi:hypothetical protein